MVSAVAALGAEVEVPEGARALGNHPAAAPGAGLPRWNVVLSGDFLWVVTLREDPLHDHRLPERLRDLSKVAQLRSRENPARTSPEPTLEDLVPAPGDSSRPRVLSLRSARVRRSACVLGGPAAYSMESPLVQLPDHEASVPEVPGAPAGPVKVAVAY